MEAFTLHACIHTALKYLHRMEGAYCILHGNMCSASKHALQGSIILHGIDGSMHTAWYRWKHAHCMVLT
jgi:hypothetical protein